ncbi:tyrosine-type recombinase/integrase [Labrys monachus]|uniref:Integrase n=1 Tax=Labrys monachus TaxID=217067 RepID=A0ABU0FC98_9HYPH|nr:site-specific integrase [Labrys monachus]MDQ0392243.1 integrase [Labrys monachus]
MASQGLGAIKGLHSLGVYHVDDVTPDKIREAVRAWLAEGYSASTVRKRLTAISFMGAPVEGCLPKLPKPLQWWLNPSYRAKAVAHLRDTATMAPHGDARLVLADYIEWVCVTGLRVEESLRLRWRDITFCPRDPRLPEDMYVLIPGTKTVASQATLPLSREAGEILLRRRNADPAAGPAGLVFPAKYRVLSTLWNECRGVLGVSDVPTATLKSFRRTAARYLHVERNMPLDVTRQYLRHSSVHTTTGYLRLVGGYSAEEMKRWL